MSFNNVTTALTGDVSVLIAVVAHAKHNSQTALIMA